jgi:hypothetical protein
MVKWSLGFMACLLVLFFVAPAFAGQVSGEPLTLSALSIDDGVPGDGLLFVKGSTIKFDSPAAFTYAIAQPALAVTESVESGVACSACSLSVRQSGQLVTLHSIRTDGSGLHQFIKG